MLNFCKIIRFIGIITAVICNFQPSIFNLPVDVSTSNLARLFFNIIIMYGGVKKVVVAISDITLLQSVPLRLCACVVDVGKRGAAVERLIADACYAIGNGYAC